MALNLTHFEYADRGETSVYKFTFREDPRIYVWFEYDGGAGALYTTPYPGPYKAEHPLEECREFKDLEDLLRRRGTDKDQWIKDLLAQYGEYIGWTYP